MKRIKKVISPLSILSLIAFLYGLKCMIFSDKHGWLALSGIGLVIELAVPCLIANIIINIAIKSKKINYIIQLTVSIIIVCVYYYNTGIMGMPFINDIQNYINNHSGNTIDTTTIDTSKLHS